MKRRFWNLFNNQRLCFLGKLLFLFFSFLISSCNDHIKYYGLNEQFDLENGKVVLRDFEILSYDEFEEIWESPKGYFIETDVDTDCATWISVFIKELNDDNFDNACW